MKTVRNVVLGTTLFLFLYTLMPHMGFSYDIIYIFFVIGSLLVPYMVYVVLKDNYKTNKKFNEGHWYEDVDKVYSKSKE